MKSETFIEKLMRAKSVKIKDGNKNIVIPLTVISQARDIALEIVAMDKHISIKELLKYPVKYSDMVEKAFHAYLDGYAESIIPAKNPGRHRAEGAVDVFKQDIMSSEGYFKRFHPDEDATQREQRALILKSGILKIVDGYLDGQAKIDRASVRNIGMNYPGGVHKGKEVTSKIMFNRYYQLMMATIVMSIVSKLYATPDAAFRNALTEKLKGKSNGTLNGGDYSREFAKSLKDKAEMVLANLDLSLIVK